ncbi:hypothetical protein WJT86_05145 [Microvirga sp. W0021]|uniref:Uncharacterized protein n=1 Tax=Hohaiivirga grylli TaxID=3133970 RepID=A0ABV0BHL3_9HYPH
MNTFILFRRKSEADFCCAVPEGKAVPGFLTEGAWEMSGKIGEGDKAWPSDFHAASANACVKLNGYYLFQSC